MSALADFVVLEEFRDAVFDFFDGKRGGHLDKYAYLISQNWEDLVSAAKDGKSGYYLARPDIEIPVLQTVALKEHLNRGNGSSITQIFEMGPGTGEKIRPFIERIRSLKSGTLIDYMMDFNLAAHDAIRATRPDLPLTLIQQDFEAPRSRTRLSGNTLGLVLGGTICNMSGRPSDFTAFPADKLSRRFLNVANFYHEGGYLVVTIDGGSRDRVMQAYSDEYNERFVMGALHLIPLLLNTDLTRERIDEAFKHTPVFHDHAQMLSHDIGNDRDITFTIEGRTFTLPAGWSNNPINSFKPSEAVTNGCAQTAGFEHMETTEDSDGLIRVIKYKRLKTGAAVTSIPQIVVPASIAGSGSGNEVSSSSAAFPLPAAFP